MTPVVPGSPLAVGEDVSHLVLYLVRVGHRATTRGSVENQSGAEMAKS